MAARRTHKKWLDDYLRFCENSESPVSYHRWSGLSLVAGALQRRVWIKWGHAVLYPNLYVVLIGPSGRSRKGEPLYIARSFMDQTSIVSLGDTNSKEAIALDMHRSEQNFNDPNTGKFHTQCAVTAMSEEIAVFLGQKDVGMISRMTNWYDSRDKWDSRTKHQGIEEVNGVCFNFLSAADPSWLPEVLPQQAVGGGLMSRIIFVVEDHKARTISNPNIYPVDTRLRETLAADLEVIMTMVGEFKLDRGALAIYEKWYKDEEVLMDNDKHAITDPTMGGYFSRRPTHVKKLGMILSACRSNDLIVTEEDLQTAIDYLAALEPKMAEVYVRMGTAKNSQVTEMILTFLRSKKRASRSEIMNRFSRHIDTAIYKEIVEDLINRRQATETLRPGHGDPILEIID